jgi:phosphatidylcholine synthase
LGEAFESRSARDFGGENGRANEDYSRPARRAAALSVYLFTASGGAFALLALYAAIERDFPPCFAWLGVASFVDGVDGTLGPFARVTGPAGMIDGAALDVVVDFLTHVLLPVVAIWRSGLIPPTAAFWPGPLVVFASALYFADTRMKTRDCRFRGFPALWNVVPLCLFAPRPPGLVRAAVPLVGSAGLFAPAVFVHPMRVRKGRIATLAVCLAFFGAAGARDLARSSPRALGPNRVPHRGRVFHRASRVPAFAVGGAMSRRRSGSKSRLAREPRTLL